jgi:hypothetical protein
MESKKKNAPTTNKAAGATVQTEVFGCYPCSKGSKNQEDGKEIIKKLRSFEIILLQRYQSIFGVAFCSCLLMGKISNKEHPTANDLRKIVQTMVKIMRESQNDEMPITYLARKIWRV